MLKDKKLAVFTMYNNNITKFHQWSMTKDNTSNITLKSLKKCFVWQNIIIKNCMYMSVFTKNVCIYEMEMNFMICFSKLSDIFSVIFIKDQRHYEEINL